MSKSLFSILAALPLLLAALLFGREPRAFEPHARVAVHAAHAHATQHDRTAIDDDDEYDDEYDVDTAMLAPPNHEVDDVAGDATSDPRCANDTHPAFATIDTSLRMTGRGIRPSGEHRSTADRPPRS
jgi:hypothetical protein